MSKERIVTSSVMLNPQPIPPGKKKNRKKAKKSKKKKKTKVIKKETELPSGPKEQAGIQRTEEEART